MASPFPGMNPYLECRDVWDEFHQNFMSRAQEALSGQVGEKYVVRLEVRLYLHELSSDERRYFARGDGGIVIEHGGTAVVGAPAAVVAPQELTLPAVDVERHSTLEIVDRLDRQVITVIELLSPTDKAQGPDRDDYLLKRNRILDQRVHFVEIDLRRGGTRPRPPELPPCDYYALVSRWESRPKVGFWPISLRERLPIVSIPLSGSDPDIPLDLRNVLDRVYDAAHYERSIYRYTPEPPLSADDSSWAQQFVPVGGQHRPSA